MTGFPLTVRYEGGGQLLESVLTLEDCRALTCPGFEHEAVVRSVAPGHLDAYGVYRQVVSNSPRRGRETRWMLSGRHLTDEEYRAYVESSYEPDVFEYDPASVDHRVADALDLAVAEAGGRRVAT